MVLGNSTKLLFKNKNKTIFFKQIKIVLIKDMITKIVSKNKRKSLNHIKHNQGQDKKDEAEKAITNGNNDT